VKFSTSNQYNLLILLRFKSICKQQDLEAQDSEAKGSGTQDSGTQDSEDSEGSEASDSPQIGTTIGHRPPIATLEAKAVSRQREKLLLDAVEDMVTASTNPSVSAIGLQSLAGLPTSLRPSDVPKHLWRGIKSTLWGMGDLFLYKEISEQQTAIAERLFRALLCSQQLNSEDEAFVGIFLDGRLPYNHRVMALEGLCLSQGRQRGWQISHYTERILDLPPIETRVLHPQIHYRILQGVEASKTSWFFIVDASQILKTFASNLSPNQPPTLQEEIMFHQLYHGMQMQGSSKHAFTVRETNTLFIGI
jgi:hypothetical protein